MKRILSMILIVILCISTINIARADEYDSEDREVQMLYQSPLGYMSSEVHKNLFDCEYPQEYKKERKEAFDLLAKAEETYQSYEDNFITVKGGKLTKSLEDTGYIWIGKMKGNKPNGKGVILQRIPHDWLEMTLHRDVYETEDVENKPNRLYIPVSVGKFNKGKADGYVLNLIGMGRPKNEGIYKAGKVHKLCIEYQYPLEVLRDPYGNSVDYGSFYVIQNYTLDVNYDMKSNVEAEPVPFNYEFANELITYERFMGNVLKEFTANPLIIQPVVFRKRVFNKGKVKSGEFYSSVDIMLNTPKTLYSKLIYKGGLKGYDTKAGKGTEYWETTGNKKYEGEFGSGWFNSGLYHGKGTLYNEDGSIKYKGKFKNGEIK